MIKEKEWKREEFKVGEEDRSNSSPLSPTESDLPGLLKKKAKD